MKLEDAYKLNQTIANNAHHAIRKAWKRGSGHFELGKLAAETLASAEPLYVPTECNYGRWSAEELQILYEAFSPPCDDRFAALDNAAEKLNRTRAQISSMVRNRGL